MTTLSRARSAAVLLLLVSAGSRPVLVQENSPIDLTGTWRWLPYEDERDRTPGAYPGDYRGLPLNDAARMRADTYDEEVNATSPLLQCRPRGPSTRPKGSTRCGSIRSLIPSAANSSRCASSTRRRQASG